MGAAARRTWAVLGEMLELGDDVATPSTTRSAGWPSALDVDRLVVVGEGARADRTAAPRQEGSWGEESAWVPDADAAHDAARARELRRG